MSSPLTPARIDQPPQFSEQLRHPLHLIENHQPLGMALEKLSRLRQAGPIGGGLQIEIEAGQLPADLQGQAGLADLPRPEQRHSGKKLQLPAKRRGLQPLNPGAIPLQFRHYVPDLQG